MGKIKVKPYFPKRFSDRLFQSIILVYVFLFVVIGGFILFKFFREIIRYQP